MNEATKRIWISFKIPIFIEIRLENIAMVNKTNLLTLISKIIYEKTGIEINASDIRIKQDKHNSFEKYISLEIPQNKADELTNEGSKRKQSRQKLILEICKDFVNDVIKNLEEKGEYTRAAPEQ